MYSHLLLFWTRAFYLHPTQPWNWRKKKVSVRFVNTDFLVLVFFFFLTTVFLLQRWRSNLTKTCMQRWEQKRTSRCLASGSGQCVSLERVLQLLQRPPSLPLSLALRRWGRPFQPLWLKRSLLLPPKGRGWPTKGRRKPIPADPMFGMTRGWQWKGRTGLWLQILVQLLVSFFLPYHCSDGLNVLFKC